MRKIKCKVKDCFKKASPNTPYCEKHAIELQLGALRVLNQQKEPTDVKGKLSFWDCSTHLGGQ